jgi:enoyl-CoA hydratase/carnithine racemase
VLADPKGLPVTTGAAIPEEAEEGLRRLGSLKETLLEVGEDHVATITLNRPDRINAFNQGTLDDFQAIWKFVRETHFVHAVVIQAEGERGFCSGVDVQEGYDRSENIWQEDDPGVFLGPRANKVWKPVVCAVHGVTAGGAFYWINESDIVICAEGTTFFDPHVSYGLTAALEPIGLARRIPLGEAIRMALMGLDERVSAKRALEIGLVTEIVPGDELRTRAREIASTIAAKPPAAIQGTVRAIWESLDETRTQALSRGLSYAQLGNPISMAQVDRESVVRPKPLIR